MSALETKLMLTDSSDEEESQYDRSLSESLESRGLVVAGEAPESDIEEDFLDANQSLQPSQSPQPPIQKVQTTEAGPSLNLENCIAVAGSILKAMNPYKYKKHIDRNKNLYKGLSDSFLERVIVDETKRLERISQNLSYSQMQMQEALMQARIGTGNLLRLQMELSNFSASSSQLQRLREPLPTAN